ncbi:hypothetical protein [Legionella hackeliae]|uniref:Glycosyltransferase RgtA/B/C/D-like domain-containing protein n=1 Tax=Legionella hackeliae TaxID=449 RepID=A0A0A8UP69_LEGHA|nr:hypothetical protein [Legionella hackeliae]KTD13483.1 hypothetical protein Lhac_0867 [Legionella hackeliae]CEK09326.1 membrane protein of unknown function [Legionella hackeliae]STX49231.1 Uncharacterised protein [Legionella hackeliae]
MILLCCALFCSVLIGWGVFFTRVLKTNLSVGLLNATAFSGLVMFYSFLFSIPHLTSLLLLGIGGFLFIFYVGNLIKKKQSLSNYQPELLTILAYLTICGLCFAIAYGLRFRSIDDYSYWGTISKYLFVFNALPNNDTYINASFLTYIPGMASFHYLLYTLTQQYSQILGYFAQGLILIAAMMVFFDPRNIARSVTHLSIWLILFTLSYGAIFARMEVDAYVAAYLFTITWLIYKKENSLSLCLPIVFLSIIKEIGLVFSILALVLLVLVERANRKILLHCVGTIALVFMTKLLWKFHVTSNHFHSFSHSVSLDSALSALNPFNTHYHVAQWLYLKEIFFARFDYLIKIPYLMLYLFIGGLWYWAVKNPLLNRARINTSMIVFAAFAVLYLLMLYFLQAIVFAVGYENKDILGFHRYYNMLFLPWLCLLIFSVLDAVKFPALDSLSKPAGFIVVSLAAILLIGGKVERVRKFYQPHQLYQLYASIDAKAKQLGINHWSVCLINPPTPAYQVSMPLSYFFMPNRILYPVDQKELASCNLKLEWTNEKLWGVNV